MDDIYIYKLYIYLLIYHLGSNVFRVLKSYKHVVFFIFIILTRKNINNEI
jgi:hypothetical protein